MGGLDAESLHAALVCHSTSGMCLPREMLDELSAHALRADSDGAPSTHADVITWGEPWISAELSELGNHKQDEALVDENQALRRPTRPSHPSPRLGL